MFLWYYAFSNIGDSPFYASFLISGWFMLVLPFQVAALLMKMVIGTEVQWQLSLLVFILKFSYQNLASFLLTLSFSIASYPLS